MDKKTKTIVIVVLAIIVIGGVSMGINRWRQQRLANQILKSVYGVDTGGGILDKVLGGGSVADQMAKEVAKEEEQQKKDEAEEAAKTPKDRYNETEEMATYDTNSTAAAKEGKNIVEEVFGDAKLITIYSNSYGSETTVSSAMEYEISRLVTGEDLGKIVRVLEGKGLPIVQSGIEDKTAMVIAGDYETSLYSIGFEIGEQVVSVTIMKISQ